MKKIKIYYNSMKQPAFTAEVESKIMIKHQIASGILLTADQYDVKKMKVVLEDDEEVVE